MQTQTSEEIKKLIMAELPRLMERDPAIRKYILKMTREQYADKIETEDRIERILDELKRDREAQGKRWEKNQRVIMEILVSIKRVDRRIDSTIGALGSRCTSSGARKNFTKINMMLRSLGLWSFRP